MTRSNPLIRLTEREEVGVVQRRHHVAACHDQDSVWVEISGPKGGGAWQMTPTVARTLAQLLTTAADRTERDNGSRR